MRKHHSALTFVTCIAALILLIAGCSSTTDTTTSAPEAGQTTATATPPPAQVSSSAITADTVTVAPDAPDWCLDIVTLPVAELSDALNQLGSADDSAARATMVDAASDLDQNAAGGDVPDTAAAVLSEVAASLRTVAGSDTLDPEALERLASAFIGFNTASEQCGFE